MLSVHGVDMPYNLTCDIYNTYDTILLSSAENSEIYLFYSVSYLTQYPQK